MTDIRIGKETCYNLSQRPVLEIASNHERLGSTFECNDGMVSKAVIKYKEL